MSARLAAASPIGLCFPHFFWRVCAANGALLDEQDKQTRLRTQKELTMSRWLDLFRSHRRAKAASERRPQRARLGLEALEDRLVPTVVVNPLLTVTLGANGTLYELVPNPSNEPQEKAIDYGVQSFTTCSFNGALYLFDLTIGGEVKEYVGPGTNWTALTGSNTKASELIKFDSSLFILGSNGAAYQTVWQYDGPGTNWTTLTGSGTNATALVETNGSLFMLATYNPAGGVSNAAMYTTPGSTGPINGVWEYSTSTDTWSAITGSNTNATALVAADGELYLLGSNGAPYQTVWQYNGFSTDWTPVTDSNTNATALVAADGGLFILNTDPSNTVMQYSGSGTYWNNVTDGSTQPQELVGFDGNLYMLGSYEGVNGSVWQYSGSGTNWTATSSWPETATQNNNPYWSGYATYSTPNVTAVAGTWVEPQVINGGSEASIWVGIDGYGNNTVEQLGVATSESSNGATVCTPWIEFYGDAVSLDINGKPMGQLQGPFYSQKNISALSGGGSFTVQVGDTVSAEISLVAGTSNSFLFQMTDKPANGGPVKTFSITETMEYVVPQRSSAEWIVENPNFGAQPFATFTPVVFTGAWATIDGTTGGVNQFGNVEAINLSSNEGQDTTTNPPITTNTLGFNETGVGLWSSIFEVSSGPTGTMITTGTYSAVATNGSVGLGVASLGHVAALVNAPDTLAPLSYASAPQTQAAHSDGVFSSLGEPSSASLRALSFSAAGEGHTVSDATDVLFGASPLFSWRGI
jgi:hypothetical protein